MSYIHQPARPIEVVPTEFPNLPSGKTPTNFAQVRIIIPLGPKDDAERILWLNEMDWQAIGKQMGWL